MFIGFSKGRIRKGGMCGNHLFFWAGACYRLSLGYNFVKNVLVAAAVLLLQLLSLSFLFMVISLLLVQILF